MKTKILPILSLLFVLFFTSNSFAQISRPDEKKGSKEQGEVESVSLKEVAAFPNPFQEYVTLNYTLASNTAGVEMTITDVYGKAVWKTASAPTTKGKHQLSLNTLKFQQGTYILTVKVHKREGTEMQKVTLYRAPSSRW